VSAADSKRHESHRRYNRSEKGRERWLRYEEGMVGTHHRLADNMRKRRARTERDREEIRERVKAHPELLDSPLYRYLMRPLGPPWKPDYNAARKTDAICARRRELGWDFVRVVGNGPGLQLGTLALQPIREEAVPRKVMEEVIALWRIRPTASFTRRERAA
jgi:hypothetical protein